MERLAYPSDLTDDQWHKIEAVLPPARSGRTGRRRKYPLRKYPLRQIGNAVFYQARTGCPWRHLPHDFAPHGDGWDHFRRWRDGGLIERVQDALREQVRVQEGREPTPSAAIIDSQSVKTPQNR